TRQDVQALEIAPGQILRVNIANGDVDVETCAEGAATVTANITAWGRTREEAEKGLAATQIGVEKAADGVSITFARHEVEQKIEGGASLHLSSDADFKIRVPAKVRLDLRTESGDLEVHGPFAKTRMESTYGDVRVRDVQGDCVARSSS